MERGKGRKKYMKIESAQKNLEETIKILQEKKQRLQSIKIIKEYIENERQIQEQQKKALILSEIQYSPIANCYYNKPAIDSKGFIPDSDNPDCYYYDMANKEDLEKMVDYFGPWFGAKICTRELAEHVDVQSYAYSRYEAMCKGETWENSAHSYTANISGLNLRALGYFAPSTDANADFQWICGSATILLKSTSTDKVDYFSFPVYSPWGSDYSDDSNVWGNNSFTGLAYGTTQYFAQVRLVMKYRNQADNGGSTNSLSFSRATTRASGKSQQSRNVRVQLVP